MMRMKRKTALYGLMIALAFIFSYIESLLPVVGIPGVKLGLANLVVLVTLYLLRPRDALAISCLRILLVGFTFGSLASMVYSLAGGLVSLGVMMLCRRTEKFSVLGVSVAGGVCHNLAQLAVAAAVLRTPQIVWYLPILLLSGVLTGALIGIVARLCLPKLRRFTRETH